MTPPTSNQPPPTATEIKRAVARLAFEAFQNAVHLLDKHGRLMEYEITFTVPNAITIKVPGPHGPHYYEVRVRELL